MAESLKNRPHEHCTTITLDDPEVFISFYDPANGFCHTFSCSEFATAFGDGLAAHKQSIGHLGACCVDEHLQKMHIANEITYEELERKQAIHRSLTCPLCPEGGIKLLPPQYYAHVCSKSHMEREKAVDGYESTGLLSWYTCREPYCPHFDEKIPPWKLSDHLRSDAHAHAHHLLQALADIGMSADQLASRAVFVRMRMCDARGCPCYGFERRFPSAELLLHHMELDTHRAVQRNQLGLPVMSQYAPEEAHFCRLIGCKGHSTFGTHDFRTSSSYARHIDGRRHQEAVGRMKERVISTLRFMVSANIPTQNTGRAVRNIIAPEIAPAAVVEARNRHEDLRRIEDKAVRDDEWQGGVIGQSEYRDQQLFKDEHVRTDEVGTDNAKREQ